MNKSWGELPNIKTVIWLACSYLVWFMAFVASANVASKALRECGFQNLGFYSLSILYLFFGLQSFLSPLIIRKVKPKKVMMTSAVGYAIWMVSLALTSIALKSETLKENLSYTAVYLIVIVSSVIVGTSASLCWVA